jgi:alanyl-tRNA synthetase
LKQQVATLEGKLAQQQTADIFQHPENVNGKTLVAAQVEVAGMQQLRALADQWKAKNSSDILVLATSPAENKVNLIVAVSPTGVKAGIKAGDLIKQIAPLVGGGGGGRPDLAQAGGKKPAGIQAALAAAKKWLTER